MTDELALYHSDYESWAQQSLPHAVVALRRGDDEVVLGVWRRIAKSRKPLVWAVMDKALRDRITRLASEHPAD